MNNLQPWVFTPVVPFILGDDISQLEEIAKIRIHIKMLINNFNDLGKEVETLSGEVANNTSAIAAINTSINDIKSQITNLVNVTNTHTADIIELKNSVADIEDSISALQNSVSALRNDLTETNRNVEQNTQSISVINDKITVIESNISTIQGNINTINNELVNLQNQVSTNTQNITANRNDINTNRQNIENNDTDIANLQQKEAEQDTKINSNTENISNLTSRTNTLETKVAANDKSITDIINKTTENSNNITSINNTITNINGTLATHTEQIGNINSRLDNIPTDIGTDVSNLTAQVNTNTSNIQTLTTNVTANTTNISSLNDNLSTAQSSINQNAANIIADERRITTNEQNITVLQAKTENIPDDLVDSVDKNTAAIANMKSDIEQNRTNITNLEAEIDTAQQDIDSNMGDITALQADVLNLQNNKVDKVTGMGLSTNDFTNEFKTILDNVKNTGPLFVGRISNPSGTSGAWHKVLTVEFDSPYIFSTFHIAMYTEIAFPYEITSADSLRGILHLAIRHNGSGEQGGFLPENSGLEWEYVNENGKLDNVVFTYNENGTKFEVYVYLRGSSTYNSVVLFKSATVGGHITKLEFYKGSNVATIPSEVTQVPSVTGKLKGVTYDLVTSSKTGLMSAIDKSNLDNLWVGEEKAYIPNNADLNDYIETGVFKLKYDDNYLNSPENAYAFLFVFEYSNGYTKQIFCSYYGYNIYVRNKETNGTWRDWTLFITEKGGTFKGNIIAPTANFTNLNVTNPPWKELNVSFETVKSGDAELILTKMSQDIISITIVIGRSDNGGSGEIEGSFDLTERDDVKKYITNKYSITSTTFGKVLFYNPISLFSTGGTVELKGISSFMVSYEPTTSSLSWSTFGTPTEIQSSSFRLYSSTFEI